MGREISHPSRENAEKAHLLKLCFVLLVKDLLHGGPESLLPLEHRLLGNNVRGDVAIQTTLEEVMGKIGDIIVGVVVHHGHVVIVGQIALVHHEGGSSVLGNVGGKERTGADLVPAGAVFATDGMTLEQNRVLVAELHPLDVDGIAGDGDAVPSATHGAVGTAKGLGQAHLLHLDGVGGDGGLLEDGTDARTGRDGVVQDLVVGFVAGLAGQVEVLPRRDVEVGLDPLVEDEVAGVVRHLLAGNVDHRREDDLLGRRGDGVEVGRGIGRQAASRLLQVLEA